MASLAGPKASNGSEFRLQAAVLCARPAAVVVGAVLSALKMERAVRHVRWGQRTLQPIGQKLLTKISLLDRADLIWSN